MTSKNTTSGIKKRLQQTRKKTALAVVPKKENQYRPLAIRRVGLAIVIVLAIGLQLGYNLTHTGSVLGRITNITDAGLLTETNDRRVEFGVKPLQISNKLSQAAHRKANDILQNQYWDHVSPEGVEPWDWIKETGYSYEVAGENLAKNFTTSSGAVAAWMNSPSHRDNLLKPEYTEVGFATVEGYLDNKPATITVAMYAKPANQAFTQSTSQFIASASSDSGSDKQNLSFAARLGIAIQSLTPAAITSVALLFMSATIAATAHAFRRKLPKHLQKTWYKRHGVIKASGLLAIAAFIILLYGGGQL